MSIYSNYRRAVKRINNVPSINRLNLFIDKNIIKVRSFEDYYGHTPETSIILPKETIDVPDLANLPLYSKSRYMRGATITIPPAFTMILDDVLYDPVSNLLLSTDREVLVDSLFPHHPIVATGGHWNSAGPANNGNPYWYNFHRKRIENIPGVCSIFRGIYKAHFHNLISEIPRVSLLGLSNLPKTQRIKLLYGETLNAVEAYFVPRLLASNVELTPVRSNRLYRIEKLIFPSYLNQQSSGYLSRFYIDEFRTKFMPKRARSPRHKIFISRRNYANKWGKRHILNEDLLYRQLQRLGFSMYIPEMMSVADQIELFYDAKMVIAAHGSALTNILYSDQVDVLELNPEFAIHPYFYLLSKSVRGRYKFWFARDVDDPDESRLFANFCVNMEEIMDLASSGFSTS